MQHEDPPGAWRDVDVSLLALTTVVGGAAWIAASVGVGYADTVRAEVAWTNLGVVGLIVFGAGNALWLLRGRRALGARRVALVRLEPARDDQTMARTPSATADAGSGLATLVLLPGVDLVHRRSCPLVAGKQVVPASPNPETASCGVCSP